MTGPELQARGLLPPGELARGLASLRAAGDWYFCETWLEELRQRVRERLRAHAAGGALDPGLPVGRLLLDRPGANAVAPLLGLERRGG